MNLLNFFKRRRKYLVSYTGQTPQDPQVNFSGEAIATLRSDGVATSDLAFIRDHVRKLGGYPEDTKVLIVSITPLERCE